MTQIHTAATFWNVSRVFLSRVVGLWRSHSLVMRATVPKRVRRGAGVPALVDLQ
jgi:hypothetical protein